MLLSSLPQDRAQLLTWWGVLGLLEPLTTNLDFNRNLFPPSLETRGHRAMFPPEALGEAPLPLQLLGAPRVPGLWLRHPDLCLCPYMAFFCVSYLPLPPS